MVQQISSPAVVRREKLAQVEEQFEKELAREFSDDDDDDVLSQQIYELARSSGLSEVYERELLAMTQLLDRKRFNIRKDIRDRIDAVWRPNGSKRKKRPVRDPEARLAVSWAEGRVRQIKRKMESAKYSVFSNHYMTQVPMYFERDLALYCLQKLDDIGTLEPRRQGAEERLALVITTSTGTSLDLLEWGRRYVEELKVAAFFSLMVVAFVSLVVQWWAVAVPTTAAFVTWCSGAARSHGQRK